jgi:hypothetical protein
MSRINSDGSDGVSHSEFEDLDFHARWQPMQLHAAVAFLALPQQQATTNAADAAQSWTR